MTEERDTQGSSSPPPNLDVNRNLTILRGKGADVEWSILKSKLDFIYEGICRMPSPGKVIQPLGFLFLGVAGTAAVEAYNSTTGTEHRHIYVVVAVAAVVIALVAFFCDWKLRHEDHRHAGWVREYMEHNIYDDMGVDPPRVPSKKVLSWLRKNGQ